METQVVPQINTVKQSGQLFVFTPHSHNTPNQRKQPPKHISGDPGNVWVGGWKGAWGSDYSCIQLSQVFLIHPILPNNFLCFTPASSQVKTRLIKAKNEGLVAKQN